MPRRFAGETSVNDREFKGSGQNAVPTRALVPTGGYSTTRCLTGLITTAIGKAPLRRTKSGAGGDSQRKCKNGYRAAEGTSGTSLVPRNCEDCSSCSTCLHSFFWQAFWLSLLPTIMATLTAIVMAGDIHILMVASEDIMDMEVWERTDMEHMTMVHMAASTLTSRNELLMKGHDAMASQEIYLSESLSSQ
ncbi:hypothetical protein AVEN_32638-1 [Araneus ventricosus]|uniref:Uncharacterized protein n=1 Tax=Araneus ventricosus TaxID=182803 RepID=A0A4Y2C754_ARAVE|nr:hypothetical protein AVEN_32638-1 [Araneus ventricosus]